MYNLLEMSGFFQNFPFKCSILVFPNAFSLEYQTCTMVCKGRSLLTVLEKAESIIQKNLMIFISDPERTCNHFKPFYIIRVNWFFVSNRISRIDIIYRIYVDIHTLQQSLHTCEFCLQGFNQPQIGHFFKKLPLYWTWTDFFLSLLLKEYRI
jgi:hypothetical protein